MRDLPPGTVTFLVSDIEGSTELSRRHGAAYGDLRAEHRRLLREALEAHRGHEVDAEGDGFFAVFERATDAVAAAVAAQRALSGSQNAVRVRMGLHTTEPILRSDGYVGVGVSRAARICAAGHGGQIVLSHATAGIVEDINLPDVTLRDLGDHYLKDITRPQRLFQVDIDGLASEFPPLGIRVAAGTVATLLATDLRDWRRVMRELGDDDAAAAVATYHRLIARAANVNNGAEVERIGDGAMCIFSSAKDAIVAAATVRAELLDSDWIQGTKKPELAAAIHTGRVTSPTSGTLGTAAIRVAQLCNSAEPGQILVSHSTHAIVEGELLGELGLRDLGEREIAGMTPTRVYELIGPTMSR